MPQDQMLSTICSGNPTTRDGCNDILHSRKNFSNRRVRVDELANDRLDLYGTIVGSEMN